MMTTFDKIEKLLAIPSLSEDEKGKLALTVMYHSQGDQEWHPDVYAHIHGRYEWFYRPDGQRRAGT